MWLCATRDLLAGAPSARLPFMEGPFSLEVSRLDGGEVLVELAGEDTRWVLGLVPLARAVLAGAEEAHAAFASDPGSAKELRGWDEVMRTLLRRLP